MKGRDSRTRALSHAVSPLISLLLLVVAVTEVAWLLGNGVEQGVVVTALINLVLVVALYMFVGNSGVFSFGHIGFALIGAYTVALLTIPSGVKSVLLPDEPPFIAHAHAGSVEALLIGSLLAAAVAFVLSIPLMRLVGLAAALGTFAVLIIINVVASNWQTLTNGVSGISGLPTTSSQTVPLVWSLIVITAAYVFQLSPYCLRLRASREDDIAARAAGIGIYNERRLAFTISAFFAGAGGALFAQYYGSFNPASLYLDLTFLTLAMLVVGGVASLSGAVIGTIVLSVIAEVLRHVEEGIHLGPVYIPARPGLANVGLALMMLLILILRPSGITGGAEMPGPGRLVALLPRVRSLSRRPGKAEPTDAGAGEPRDPALRP